MRRFSLLLVIALVLSGTVFSQNQYETISERPNEKSLKGIISREILESDTAFQWYKANYKAYAPYGDAVDGLKKYADSIQVLTFMGTWCEDSQFIIPRLYALLDAANFPKDKITLIGVDRKKKTLSHLCEALNIINVPTIIILKNGKELGRVVEYGKSGSFDKDLAEIIHLAGQ